MSSKASVLKVFKKVKKKQNWPFTTGSLRNSIYNPVNIQVCCFEMVWVGNTFEYELKKL